MIALFSVSAFQRFSFFALIPDVSEPGGLFVRLAICFILCMGLGFAAGMRAGWIVRGWTECGARRMNHWQKVDAAPDNALVSDGSALRWMSLCDVRDVSLATAPAKKDFRHGTGAARLSGSTGRAAPIAENGGEEALDA